MDMEENRQADEKQKFFTLEDDFEAIIGGHLKDVVSIEKIPTGWTNYVFCAKTKSGRRYIFRFPRNDFFADCIVKEIPFNRFVRTKVGVKTANLRVLEHNGRAFSMHPMIKGTPLQAAFPKLSASAKKQLAIELTEYISSLQKVKLPGYTCPSASHFLEGLSKVNNRDCENYLSRLEYLREMELRAGTTVHGDLNPGNIIVDDEGHVVAVLDYAFITCSCTLHDLARICGRLPADFRDIMIAEFEKKFNTTVNIVDLDYLIDLWTYVENDYKDYMMRCHPDIIMPSY